MDTQSFPTEMMLQLSLWIRHPNVGETAFGKTHWLQTKDWIQGRWRDVCILYNNMPAPNSSTSIPTQGSTFCQDTVYSIISPETNKETREKASSSSHLFAHADQPYNEHVLLSMKEWFPARLTVVTSYLIFQFAEIGQTMLLSNLVICTNSLCKIFRRSEQSMIIWCSSLKNKKKDKATCCSLSTFL